MTRLIDHHTNTVADAEQFERWRGQVENVDPGPTKAEIEREEYGPR